MDFRGCVNRAEATLKMIDEFSMLIRSILNTKSNLVRIRQKRETEARLLKILHPLEFSENSERKKI